MSERPVLHFLDIANRSCIYRLDFSDTFKVLVGSDETEFTVPREVLTKSSDVLRKCCEGEWKEAKSRIIKLPEEDVDVFSTYIQWLHTNDLVVVEEELQDMTDRDFDIRNDAAALQWDALVNMASFADRQADLTLANAVNDSILLVMMNTDLVPAPKFLSQIYTELPENSKLRCMVVDEAVYSDAKDYQADQEDHPTQFFLDIWARLQRARDDENDRLEKPKWNTRCHYHEHNVQVPKTSKCTGKRQ